MHIQYTKQINISINYVKSI